MNLTSISSTVGLYTSQSQTASAWQQDFQALGSALQSGNLSGAQSAFSALTQSGTGGFGGMSAAALQNQTVANDFNALSTALQSGNVADAQKAFATLRQDLSGLGHSHRHHHARATATSASGTQTAASADNDGDRDGSGTAINATA